MANQPVPAQPLQQAMQSAPVTPVAAPIAQQQVQQAPVPDIQQQPVQQPVGMTDRSGEQWDKLTDNNRKLFEANQILQQELQKRSVAQQTFQPIQQTQPTPQSQQVNPDDFVVRDPITGERYVDDARLRSAIAESNKNAELARQEVATVRNYIQANEQKELVRQESEAFKDYPELNPKGQNFDIDFHNRTSALILHSLVNPQNYGGRSLTFREAAASARGQNKTVAPIQAQPVQNGGQPSQSTQDLKVQASVDLPSQPQQMIPAQQQADMTQLKMRTRYGDDEALAQRLMHTEHLVPKT